MLFILVKVCIVVTVENVLFAKVFKITLIQALILSVSANLVSYFAGIMLGQGL